LYKAVVILYLVCLGCYILFTRQPDFFDGEKTPAIIHFQDSVKQQKPFASFELGDTSYLVNASYPLRSFRENEKVEVIYVSSHPEQGVIYSWWGYWFSWGELLGSALLLIALFQIAVAVTKNPSEEAVKEQEGFVEEKKRKYVD